jgi:hypothetical protein
MLSELQRQAYRDCVDAHWDPSLANTFAEECAHLQSELSEAFEAFRRYHDCRTYITRDGKPEGVPVEFADVLIGMLYCAERFGFSLDEAYALKSRWNQGRDYSTEGRQLHPVVSTDA